MAVIDENDDSIVPMGLSDSVETLGVVSNEESDDSEENV